MCKLTSSSQCAFVFFSSFSVVVIAIDRLLVVTHSSKLQITCKMVGRICTRVISQILMLYVLLQALGISVVGFFCCLLISSPLFYFTRLETIFLDASYCYEVTYQKCHIKILLFNLKYVNDYLNKSCRIGPTSL